MFYSVASHSQTSNPAPAISQPPPPLSAKVSNKSTKVMATPQVKKLEKQHKVDIASVGREWSIWPVYSSRGRGCRQDCASKSSAALAAPSTSPASTTSTLPKVITMIL